MNQEVPQDGSDPVSELLKAADPAGDSSSLLMPRRSKDDLFQEITMTSPVLDKEPAAGVGAANEPPRRRRSLIAPVALAAVVLFAAIGFAVTRPAQVSAQELVAEAATNIGPVTSGRVAVSVDPGGVEQASSADYRFENGNFEVSVPAGADFGELLFLSVDGQIYNQMPPITEVGEFFLSDGILDDIDHESILNLDDGNALDPARIVPIIEGAENFSEVSSTDGITIYRGTVPGPLLEALDRATLPAGVGAALQPEGFVAGRGPGEYGPTGWLKPETLPAIVGLEVVVTEERLTSLALDIPEYLLTVTYAELGEPQNIEAPTNVITEAEAERRFGELFGE